MKKFFDWFLFCLAILIAATLNAYLEKVDTAILARIGVSLFEFPIVYGLGWDALMTSHSA